MSKTYKMIKIPYNGPIMPLGGVYGPINSPFKQEVNEISALIMKGYPIIEVLNNGSEVNLTLSNFDKDNNPKVEKKENIVVENRVKPEQQISQAKQNIKYTNKQKNNFQVDTKIEK